MRKIILFIATSLDGFIARENGDVDWLFTDRDYGYKDFVNTIDTVLMGGATYRQVLSFEENGHIKQRTAMCSHMMSL